MSTTVKPWFPQYKPILAMLHLGGDDAAERLSRAREEARLLADCGVDALIVENYFGDESDVELVLEAFAEEPPGPVVGVNVLRNTERAFELAAHYPVKFIQVDSVVGHLTPEEDDAFAERFAALRETVDAFLLGGVRFKYQPVRSGRSEAEDLRIGANRCDGIVVTGEGTGMVTDLEKVQRFRSVLGDVPLIVGAGVTAANVREQLQHADGAIVGSYFKEGHRDTGRVVEEHVRAFMAEVIAMRDEETVGP